MFVPGSGVNKEKAAKRKREAEITAKSYGLVPLHLQEGLLIDVKEVVCGDPSCAPVDTIFTFVWSGESLGKGMFAVPAEINDISDTDLEEYFPDEDCLTKWKAGKRVRWPPAPEMGPLRFNVGDRVECRIGPHPVTGWAAGRVVKLYYKEPNWPPNMVAPYQIALHDGRVIFAPADVDNVIRLREAPLDTEPASPDLSNFYDYTGNTGNDADEGDEDEDDDISIGIDNDDNNDDDDDNNNNDGDGDGN